MNIYQRTKTNYRKIYEEHNGPIPKGFHIHHIDGNSDNNDPSNLICLSPQEHYDIHYKQQDYRACLLLLKHGCLSLSIEERSELSRKYNLKRVANGTHLFSGGEIQRKSAIKRWEQGTHNFIGYNEKRIQDGTHNFLGGETQRKNAIKNIENGTHNFIANHPTKQIVTCPHCNKSGPKPQMLQWHFDKCKSKK